MFRSFVRMFILVAVSTISRPALSEPMRPSEIVDMAYKEALEVREFVDNFDSDDPVERRDTYIARMTQVEAALKRARRVSDGCDTQTQKEVSRQEEAILLEEEEVYKLWDKNRAVELDEHGDVLLEQIDKIIEMKVKLVFYIAEKGFGLKRR